MSVGIRPLDSSETKRINAGGSRHTWVSEKFNQSSHSHLLEWVSEILFLIHHPTMPLFCSSKSKASREFPYSWYWSGKPLRAGYKRGEFIREVHTDIYILESRRLGASCYPSQRHNYRDCNRRYRCPNDASDPPRRLLFPSGDRNPRASCCPCPPRDSGYQQERYQEYQCYCTANC
ncbi:hypothetical protein BDV12DRAFT_166567 [Aspergillus spectabilis]